MHMYPRSSGDVPDALPPTPRHRRAPSRRVPALLMAVALAVAACGSTVGATPASSTSPGTAAQTSSVTSAPQPGASAAPSVSSTDGALGQLQQEYESVVQRVSPSVVVIETSLGLGSGIVLDTTGDIVTNAHVVGGANSFTVTLADGRQYPGKLVGTFVANDIAVIRIDAPDLRPATFADSSQLQVGQIVMAVGNPLGFQSSVTEGIVSALGRTVGESGGVTLPGTIQTSAAINPGNSGGALVDINGNVVGIPTLAAVDQQIGGAAAGIGFAIPSNDAVDFANQLIKDGKVTDSHRAYLGIRSADVMGAQGVLVYSVQPGGPAAAAGIKAGELITSIDGQDTPDAATLSKVLAGLKPGDTVKVVLQASSGGQKTLEVTLGEIPG